MKKALILGTNAGQADIIRFLRNTGWEVHACGKNREGTGINYAHYFHITDTIDVFAVKNLAEKISADIVYSVSSDINIRTATIVSEQLNLPVLLNSEIIDLFHFKNRLRNYLNQNNLSTVKYSLITSLLQLNNWNTFPCVVKPCDSQGQRGIKLITTKSNLAEAVQNAKRNSKIKTVIIEEFLSGVEISTNIIVQDGKILINEFTERIVHDVNFFGLPKGHHFPVRNVSSKNIEDAKTLITQLIKKLQIKNAVLYFQLKVTENGPKIIEIAPRLDGCHIWRLLKFSRGYDLRQFVIDCLLGIKIQYNANNNLKYTPHTLKFYQMESGSIFTLNRIHNNEQLEYKEFRYNEGEIVQPINGILEVVGYCINKG